ncbi:MAG: NYN domain-containing protein [Actinobacteria bacterium]|nr:NYN domain-containing protein [Actinomycetota bacterium]
MADGDEIPDRVVASALEFAVGIAAAGSRLRPPLPYPAELRPYLKFTKLQAKALREVRKAVEGDAVFLRRLGVAAVPELVDEAGMLWLQRPDGWQDRLSSLAAQQAEAGQLDAAAELRKAERRRVAAEEAAHRVAAEVESLRLEVERLHKLHADAEAEIGQLRRERDALRGEASTHQVELRRAVHRLASAQAKVEAHRAEAASATERAVQAERMRDEVLATRANGVPPAPAESHADVVLAGAAALAADLAQQVQQARTMAVELGRLAGRLESLELAAPIVPEPAKPARGRGRRSNRKPVALPGGVYGSSAAATEFLVRYPEIVVLIDGYNVAKLGWPLLDLEAQRERCVESCEDVARRFGTHIAVVFDGSTVPGAAAPGRRLVRVSYSPEGVIADDVLRAEVDTLPDDVPVLVVTNDQAVLTDVRAMGANTLSSDQWLELSRR